LRLPPESRIALWQHLAERIEKYANEISTLPVAPRLSVESLRELLAPFDFATPVDPMDAVDFVAGALTSQQVHTPHPLYFGLFNPNPATMGIAGDALTAAFNPQIAAWSHSPFAAEVEMLLCRAFGARFGYDAATVDGVFCSGGAEANHTAILTALTHNFPEVREEGVRALSGQPTLYVSAESHHSLLKAARACGLGSFAVREVALDRAWRMDPEDLAASISRDRSAGMLPFLVAATAGTTNCGAIDPLLDLAGVANEAGAWFHVDAAWGGAAALDPDLRRALTGIERADSITFDAHKWLSVPMGAGMYLTRHPNILLDTFRTPTAYMPKDAAGMDVIDPHQHSLQWSRRFTGLKVFLSLAVAGWDGYRDAIRHMTEMGNLLRSELRANGWEVVNDTPLPLVCFRRDGVDLDAVAREVVASGKAWISTTRLGRTEAVLRACITNFETGPEHIRTLVAALKGHSIK
jgi:glutamate/tyrosine decarboxylase-like PLP-dependent enzyme